MSTVDECTSKIVRFSMSIFSSRSEKSGGCFLTTKEQIDVPEHERIVLPFVFGSDKLGSSFDASSFLAVISNCLAAEKISPRRGY